MDEVRQLTNISTGRLGSELTSLLAQAGHEVTLLRSASATHLAQHDGVDLRLFTTSGDLKKRLKELADSAVDAVFHAAAVGDFTGQRLFRQHGDGALIEISGGKIDSREGPLLWELVPAEKIIGRMRAWFPAATIVGWKYEVDGGTEYAIDRSRDQIQENLTDGCVINGPAYGEGFGWVDAGSGDHRHLGNRENLFAFLQSLLEEA